ncbi:MAG TPA: hypothetical protein VMA09_03780 [Candidatus Binataceae bacterium]|nr:hypothetical protein [Candidatus Binataceae bacterium]
MLASPPMAIPAQRRQWPRDLKIFAGICVAWGAMLLFRVAFDHGSAANPFQDVFLGVKQYGQAARITMAIQAAIFLAFGIGILMRRRWALLLGLLYFAQVVFGHVIFFVRNVRVPDQAIHVKITAIEAPIVFAILIYFWIRARPLLKHKSA